MTQTTQKTFYGWWITAASFVILFITVGVGLYVPPVFLVPLQEHFGWTRAAIAGGSATAALTAGLASPLAGVLIDKYGARRVMASAALLMGCGFGLFGLMQSLWQLYVLNALAAAGIACSAWIPNQTLIANWFEKKRGLAMGIAMTGIGFGGLAMAPLAGWLIARFGWRFAFLGLSSSILVIVVAVVLAMVRDRPADLGLVPDGAPSGHGSHGNSQTGRVAGITGGPGLELSQSVRTSAFWILFLSQLLTTFGSMSIVGHLVAFLRDSGFEGQTAASSLGLMVGASVGGRILFGFFADKLTKRHIMSLALALHGLATVLLFSIESAAALPAFVVIFGVALGGGAVLIPLLVGECFGLLAFGKILGLVMVSGTLGAALGPVLTGRIFDVTGSYRLAFMLHIGGFLAAALVMQMLSNPRAATGTAA